jgi:hypothetical protein
VTGHFGDLKHQSILDALAKSDPYSKIQVTTVDQFLNAGLPIVNSLYTLHMMVKHKEEMKKKSDVPIQESETASYCLVSK